jgi:hypothetical protein
MSGVHFALSLTLMALLGLSGCQERNTMNSLNEKWTTVIRSQSSAEEARAVAALKDYLKKRRVSFSAVVVNEAGAETPYGEFPDDGVIRSVRLTFYTQEGQFKAPEWSPKGRENFRLLFLE